MMGRVVPGPKPRGVGVKPNERNFMLTPQQAAKDIPEFEAVIRYWTARIEPFRVCGLRNSLAYAERVVAGTERLLAQAKAVVQKGTEQ